MAGKTGEKKPKLRFGDVVEINWNHSGMQVDYQYRYGVVIQNDFFNSSSAYPNVIVAAISYTSKLGQTRVEVNYLEKQGTLPKSFCVKCEQIFTIPKDLIGNRRDRLTGSQIAEVQEAILRALNIKREEQPRAY